METRRERVFSRLGVYDKLKPLYSILWLLLKSPHVALSRRVSEEQEMDAGREAKHTPGAMHPWAPKGWMWTPQQWAEIVDRSRKAVACRQKARIDRNEARHFDSRHWLMRDARSAEKEARTHERRVHSLVRCWLPEVLS